MLHGLFRRLVLQVKAFSYPASAALLMVGALAWIHAARAMDRMRGRMSYGQREMGVMAPIADGRKPRLLE